MNFLCENTISVNTNKIKLYFLLDNSLYILKGQVQCFSIQLVEMNKCLSFSLGTHLFVKIFDQETAKGPLLSSSQAATCYYQSNHSKVEAIPLSSLPTSLSPHYPFLLC